MSLSDFDLHLMHEGNHSCLYEHLGAHKINDKEGYRFSLYAPNAQKVYIYGTFNDWKMYELELYREDSGVFSIELDEAKEYDAYKYIVIGCDGIERHKADPFAFLAEKRPSNASRIYDYRKDIVEQSSFEKNYSRPFNVFEVHASGFKHKWEESPIYTYEELTEVINYACDMKYTAVEFLPLTEHPFDGSWGYQPSGFFAPTSRYGTPDGLCTLVRYAEKCNMPLILDFVLGHFCKDDFGLGMFDGTPLFEAEYNALWGVYNFNYETGFVRSFLKSAVLFWLRHYAFDGIRVDAVSYMLYFDGNERNGIKHAAVEFIKSLNWLVEEEFQGRKVMIAEDSSTFPGVTRSVHQNGLGFDYKWKLGWMHDNLKFFETDPLHRGSIFNKLTFSFHYMFEERYILPLSHDEVVHLKQSMLHKMWGEGDIQFDQLRQLYAHMIAHPGKSLTFMGNDLAVHNEFNEDTQLDWEVLREEKHRLFNAYCKRLNDLYLHVPALSECDFKREGFSYMYDHASDNVLMYKRISVTGDAVYIVLNTSSLYYHEYLLHLTHDKECELILNSSDPLFGGKHILKYRYLPNEHNQILIDLPEFTTLYIYQQAKERKKTLPERIEDELLRILKNRRLPLTTSEKLTTEGIKMIIENIEEYRGYLDKKIVRQSQIENLDDILQELVSKKKIRFNQHWIELE